MNSAKRLSSFPLRLFQDGDPTDDLKPRRSTQVTEWSTLTDLYDLFVLPKRRVRQRSQPRTIEQDRNALAIWERLTGNPPLCRIDAATVEAFSDAYAECPGRDAEHVSPNSIRKVCTHLQFILDAAGPEVRRDRPTAGIFDRRPPYIPRPPLRDKPAEDQFTLDEIQLLIEACRFAPRTTSLMGHDPATWWRSLFTFLYNTGLRIGSAIQAEWSMVDCDKPGWISIPAAIYKGGKVGHQIYLNRWARAAIDAVRRPGQSRLFPWTDWPASNTWLHACRRKILESSTIRSDHHYGFHALRKSLISWLAGENPMLASMVAGHRTGNVTRDHYVKPDVVKALLDRVPQPVPFRQKDLF